MKWKWKSREELSNQRYGTHTQRAGRASCRRGEGQLAPNPRFEEQAETSEELKAALAAAHERDRVSKT